MLNIKRVIGIVSCKGGVGKSTLAVNVSVLLSFFLKKKVGLLDADIYGPNHPEMLGLSKDKKINFNEKFLSPKEKYNLLSMSMGYFLDVNSPILFRGPMVSSVINLLLKKTNWGFLDLLVIDFPPGTGDIYLSLLRDIKIDGVFLVTTPQLVSIGDVKRSVSMLRKFNISILGILENMRCYKCIYCGSFNYIHKSLSEVENLRNVCNLTFVHKLPLHNYISESSNKGIPFVLNKKCSDLTLVVKDIAERLL